MRTDIGDGGPALFRLVRFWSRRWAGGTVGGVPGGAERDSAHVAHVRVLEAIDAARTGASALIGDVAAELGLDRSNASRMLADAVAAGLVTRTVSLDDARRTELGITPDGDALLAAARAWQATVFEQMVASWPTADARRFASYLTRLAAQSTRPFIQGDRR